MGVLIRSSKVSGGFSALARSLSQFSSGPTSTTFPLFHLGSGVSGLGGCLNYVDLSVFGATLSCGCLASLITSSIIGSSTSIVLESADTKKAIKASKKANRIKQQSACSSERDGIMAESDEHDVNEREVEWLLTDDEEKDNDDEMQDDDKSIDIKETNDERTKLENDEQEMTDAKKLEEEKGDKEQNKEEEANDDQAKDDIVGLWSLCLKRRSLKFHHQAPAFLCH
nr:hypothetical protein [Tanacetum cinerariifolium]